MVNLVNEHLDFNRKYNEDVSKMIFNTRKFFLEKNILGEEECEIYD